MGEKGSGVLFACLTDPAKKTPDPFSRSAGHAPELIAGRGVCRRHGSRGRGAWGRGAPNLGAAVPPEAPEAPPPLPLLDLGPRVGGVLRALPQRIADGHA